MANRKRCICGNKRIRGICILSFQQYFSLKNKAKLTMKVVATMLMECSDMRQRAISEFIHITANRASGGADSKRALPFAEVASHRDAAKIARHFSAGNQTKRMKLSRYGTIEILLESTLSRLIRDLAVYDAIQNPGH